MTSAERIALSFLVTFSSVGKEITFDFSRLRFIEDDTVWIGKNSARIWSNQVQILKSRIRSDEFQRDSRNIYDLESRVKMDQFLAELKVGTSCQI